MNVSLLLTAILKIHYRQGCHDDLHTVVILVARDWSVDAGLHLNLKVYARRDVRAYYYNHPRGNRNVRRFSYLSY